MKSERKRKKQAVLAIVLLVLGFGCIDPYTPETTTTDFNFLVVEGFYNHTDTTFIRLSRTQPLTSEEPSAPETSAEVTIQEENGSTYALLEKTPGVYYLLPGHFSVLSNLRLVIKTGGNDYASPYVPVKIAPAMDSITWKQTTTDGNPGVGIYANAHDASAATRYYFYEYTETWEYSSKFRSDYERIGDTIVPRPYDKDISHCWKTFPSNKILVTSTTALAEDRVSEFPLTFVNKYNPKLSYRYSMLVNQYALTPEAYQYWLTIQKNSENLGTVFGPLPSQITGNIVSTTDPGQKALGFFSASSGSSLRFNIYRGDLTPVSNYQDGYEGCYGSDIFVALADALQPTSNLYLYARYEGITLIGYQQASRDCTDCRLKGGITTQPSWW